MFRDRWRQIVAAHTHRNTQQEEITVNLTQPPEDTFPDAEHAGESTGEAGETAASRANAPEVVPGDPGYANAAESAPEPASEDDGEPLEDTHEYDLTEEGGDG